MTEIIYTLIVTHITIICVTIFLHRSTTHKGILLNKYLEHFMRFWLWLTTGMVTKEWVAIHRMHHQMCEKKGDPHSPHIYGIWRVLFGGSLLYHNACKDSALIDKYGTGTPDDWVERNVYTLYSRLGIIIMLNINILLFGFWGLLIWIIQMIWIPFWAAGVVNGLGHWFGYRNGITKNGDNSRNVFPIDVLVGGELLHNNHHLEPSNPKLSRRWFEFDIGWLWFRIFQILKLAKLKNDR